MSQADLFCRDCAALRLHGKRLEQDLEVLRDLLLSHGIDDPTTAGGDYLACCLCGAHQEDPRMIWVCDDCWKGARK